MAARAGLGEHIAWLRGMVSAGTSDYSVGGVDYWTDDQLQQALDQARIDVSRERITPVPAYSDGGLVYTVYHLNGRWVEGVASGAVAWNLVDGSGGVVATDGYTVDVVNGIVTFDADTEGDAYLVDYRAYDLNAAAALVWEMKAAHFAGRYDVKTDNHDLKRSQLLRQAQEMAKHYRSKATVAVASGSSVKRMRRDDTV
jgi:hypothetical protein